MERGGPVRQHDPAGEAADDGDELGTEVAATATDEADSITE